jgi:CubicO group peptidase (beta-lactamase class C family)
MVDLLCRSVSLVTVLGAVLVPAFAWADLPPGCGEVSKLEDGWKAATLQQERLDPEKICALASRLAALKDANAHGVLIARHGALVYETYFAGDDQRWPQQHWKEPLQANVPHDARAKHDLQSISKSVTALLIGVAHDRRALTSIDASVLSLFPEYADLRTPQRDRIRIRDLLTMTSGLRWLYKPYLATSRKMEASSDPARFVLEQPMVAEPGLEWHYNNGSAEVAGAVLKKTTGVPVDQLAKEALFVPLGIDDWEWGRMASGDPGASWGLRLRLRDLAKIGQLVLDRGRWHGRQIVSDNWIALMIAPHIVRAKVTYGFFWWLDRQTIGGNEIGIVYASGWGGQSLTIVPSLDLVIAVNAGVYNFEGQGNQDLAIDTVLDAVLHATTGQ